ncbi:MAG TPA: PQQ-binding-like beta-propeller repeat protein [Holophagaceae bacterium]|nr:PQQ-binding-like beta-propeller repeat protein [Holophagaceae bacterium]
MRLRSLPLVLAFAAFAQAQTASPMPPLVPGWVAQWALRSRGGAEVATAAPGGSAAWRVVTGQNDAPPMSDGMRVVVVHANPKRVEALDPATGRSLWAVPFTGLLDQPPQFAGEAVVFALEGGRVVVLDAATGALRHLLRLPPWKSARGGGAPARLRLLFPAVSGQTLVAGWHTPGQESRPEQGLFAFDLGTGALRWAAALPGASEVHPLVMGNRVVAGGDGQLTMLDLETGRTVWISRTPRRASFESAQLIEDRLFVRTAQELLALDPVTGRVLWTQEAPGCSLLVGAGDRIAFTLPRGTFNPTEWVVAYNARTGERAWEREADEARQPWIQGGRLLINAKEELQALDLMTGTALWRRDLTGALLLPLRVQGEAVLALHRARGGTRLAAYRLTDGVESWSTLVKERTGTGLLLAGPKAILLPLPEGGLVGLR